jgi:hypothetical protein
MREERGKGGGGAERGESEVLKYIGVCQALVRTYVADTSKRGEERQSRRSKEGSQPGLELELAAANGIAGRRLGQWMRGLSTDETWGFWMWMWAAQGLTLFQLRVSGTKEYKIHHAVAAHAMTMHPPAESLTVSDSP